MSIDARADDHLTVLLLADTHGLHHPAVDRLVVGVDEVWHAGDWVTAPLLEHLRALRPVHAVRGNNDRNGSPATLPDALVIERRGWRVLVRHIVGTPARPEPAASTEIASLRPHLLLHGHSHRPLLQAVDGLLWCNPGSAGPRRFSLPRSAGLLVLSSRRCQVRLLDLDSGETTHAGAWRRDATDRVSPAPQNG